MINDVSYCDAAVKPISGLYYDNGNRCNFFWAGSAVPNVALGARTLGLLPYEHTRWKPGMHCGL